NLALERSLGQAQTISATYVGASGRKLLRVEQLVNPNPNFVNVYISKNSATSDYNALQIQFTRRMARGLQVLSSYSWSHSIDTASNDSSTFSPGAFLDPQNDRGSSDFDIRHSLNAAVTYSPGLTSLHGVSKAVLGGWSIDSIL